MRMEVAIVLGCMAAGVALTTYGVAQSENYELPARALRAQGWTDVAVRSGTSLSALAGCGDGEIAYDARARNSAGELSDVLVCCRPVLRACFVRAR